MSQSLKSLIDPELIKPQDLNDMPAETILELTTRGVLLDRLTKLIQAIRYEQDLMDRRYREEEEVLSEFVEEQDALTERLDVETMHPVVEQDLRDQLKALEPRIDELTEKCNEFEEMALVLDQIRFDLEHAELPE